MDEKFLASFDKPRVLLDERLIDKNIIRTISESTSKKRVYNSNLFSYLEEHPYTGIITGQTEEVIVKKYWKPYQRLRQRNQQMIHEFDEMLERFLIVEHIKYPAFQESMKRVEDFFKELMEEKKPIIVANRYRELIDSLEISQSRIPAPDEKDKKCLAEASVLVDKYKQMLLASPSTLLTKPYVSNMIEEKLCFSSGDADYVLTKLSK